MGTAILILGESGSGKSTSLRNMNQDEVGVFNVVGKPLPFRGGMRTVDTHDYSLIKATLKANNLDTYVIDDANYLMQLENFERCKENGYSKFTEMALNFEQLLTTITHDTSRDTIVYIMMHPEIGDNGRLKPKTIGKMLDNQLTIEGMVPMVLLADYDKSSGRYGFYTSDPGGTPVKSPIGMFDDDFIDNDLAEVDRIARDYWGINKRRKDETD